MNKESRIRVCIAGATGRVGASLAKGIVKSEDLELVSAVAIEQGENLGSLIREPSLSLVIKGTVDEALRTNTDVLVDYTTPSIVKNNAMVAIAKGVHVVIGTTGLSPQDYQQIDEAARSKRVGVIAGGNFALTANLMMRFAVTAAEYIAQWEIIDLAEDAKIDCPSGTSQELAERLSKVRKPKLGYPIEETHGSKESRGATIHGSQIHSLRLAGHPFSTEIIFAMPGEKLVLRHEAENVGTPYVEGTFTAIRKVISLVGLEKGIMGML